MRIKFKALKFELHIGHKWSEYQLLFCHVRVFVTFVRSIAKPRGFDFEVTQKTFIPKVKVRFILKYDTMLLTLIRCLGCLIGFCDYILHLVF